MKIEINVDRRFCPSCYRIFPKIAFELGDPEVTIDDAVGFRGTVHGGAWK